ncbi:hypothetical protein Syun_020334 [Stephania yunnanensis]|uniref:TF-B3 domain-containing protein n=1 Tax=Stephania yunnanensis TaxID=152371 RepID=A0AAP0IF84_9MAGN
MGFKKRDPEAQNTERAFVEVAMRRGGREPCEECVERCRRVHGRRPSAWRVTCFFKIMLSDDVHSVMFIPPKFARTIMSLAGQRVRLEDINGNCWTVKISLVGGQLAFKRGWRKFFVDHSIEIGDLLMFHYHLGSQFMVKIFDRSACERLNFSDKSGVDEGALLEGGEVHLPSSVLDLTPVEDPLPINDEVSVEKEGSCSAVNSHSDHRDAEALAVRNNEALDGDNIKSRPHAASSQGCAEVPSYMIDRNAVYEERARSSLFDSSNMEIAGCNNAVEEPEVLKNEQSSCSSVELIDSNASLNETMRKRKTCEGASPDATVVKVLRRKCTSVDAQKAESKAICEIVTASPLAQIESNLDHGKAVTQNPGISYEAPRGDSPDVPGLEVPSIKCSNEYADKVQQKPTGVHGTASLLALTSTLDHGKATMQNLGLSNEATKGISPDVSLVVEAPGRKCTSEDVNEVQSKTTCEHGTASPLAQIEPAINHDKATRETASNVSMSEVFRRKCSYLDTDKVQLETTREDGAASPCAPIDSTPDHEKAGLQDLEISNKATRAASPDVLAVKASNRNFTFGVASRLRSKTLAHGKSATLNLGISNADRRGPSPDVLVVEMPTRKCTSERCSQSNVENYL